MTARNAGEGIWTMTVSGMRATLAARAALDEAGLGHENARYDVVEGWIRPDYANSLGHGIRQCDDGTLEWNLILTGRPHVAYGPPPGASNDWDEHDGDAEPEDLDVLHDRVRAVYEGLGLTVASVRTSSWGVEDVRYIVTTARPDWLEAYDAGNRQPPPDGPRLTGYRMRHDALPGIGARGDLPGYAFDGRDCLTRESVEALVAAAPRSGGRTAMRLDGDVLTILRQDRGPRSVEAVEVTNHWGDVVKCWPLQGVLKEHALVDPTVPYVLDGEVHAGPPAFDVIDRQEGDAPWTPAPPAPGTR